MAKRKQGVSKRAANSAKAKHSVPKSGPVWHRSAEEATLDQMPKFNGFRCKTGAHGDAKYNRAKAKRSWQQQLRHERTRTRGSLPFSEGARSHHQFVNPRIFALPDRAVYNPRA